MPWRGKGAGVYVVAYGDPARQCADRCLKSVAHHMPAIGRALVSDRPLGPETVLLTEPDEDIGARSVKTRMYDVAPTAWEYVLYLDADTEMIAPTPFLFDVLADGWDMAICLNPGKYAIIKNMTRPDNQDECAYTYDLLGTDQLLQLQGGVMSFRRNERTAAFFHAWHEEWHRWAKRDQGALLRAMYANPLKLYILGVEWNTSTRYNPVEQSAGILHHQMEARRWKGIIKGRLDSGEAWGMLHPDFADVKR